MSIPVVPGGTAGSVGSVGSPQRNVGVAQSPRTLTQPQETKIVQDILGMTLLIYIQYVKVLNRCFPPSTIILKVCKFGIKKSANVKLIILFTSYCNDQLAGSFRAHMVTV